MHTPVPAIAETLPSAHAATVSPCAAPVTPRAVNTSPAAAKAMPTAAAPAPRTAALHAAAPTPRAETVPMCPGATSTLPAAATTPHTAAPPHPGHVSSEPARSAPTTPMHAAAPPAGPDPQKRATPQKWCHGQQPPAYKRCQKIVTVAHHRCHGQQVHAATTAPPAQGPGQDPIEVPTGTELPMQGPARIQFIKTSLGLDLRLRWETSRRSENVKMY